MWSLLEQWSLESEPSLFACSILPLSANTWNSTSRTTLSAKASKHWELPNEWRSVATTTFSSFSLSMPSCTQSFYPVLPRNHRVPQVDKLSIILPLSASAGTCQPVPFQLPETGNARNMSWSWPGKIEKSHARHTELAVVWEASLTFRSCMIS